MGIVFGRITVEQPKYELLQSLKSNADKYQIRKYPPCVAVRVYRSELMKISSSSSSQEELSIQQQSRQFSSEGFGLLARYIGVFGTPMNKAAVASASVSASATSHNHGEKVEMTAPVTSEKIEMTAPVTSEKMEMTTSVNSEKVEMTAPVTSEKIEMTAPVTSESSRDESMSFLLPAKYTLDTAPIPTDPRVHLVQVPDRVEAVYVFGGAVDMDSCHNRVDELRGWLKQDGIKETGNWYLARYNPPFTIPFMRTNEIHIPVEAPPAAPASQH